MKSRKKPCNGPICEGAEAYIYKTQGRERFCKSCWYRLHPPAVIKSSKPPKPRSSKREQEDTIYAKLREEQLAEKPFCEIGLPGCTRHATEIHHTRGRGVWYLIKKYFKSACRNCHQFCTEHSKEAIALGHSESRLNDNNNDTDA